MREIVSPIPVVLARPQQGSLAFQVRVPNAVTAAARRAVSLVSFTVPQDRCEERYVAPLAGLTADPGTLARVLEHEAVRRDIANISQNMYGATSSGPLRSEGHTSCIAMCPAGESSFLLAIAMGPSPTPGRR